MSGYIYIKVKSESEGNNTLYRLPTVKSHDRIVLYNRKTM